MQLKLSGKEVEAKVTARSVAMLEKETKSSIQDILTPMSEGKMPKIEVIAAMVKQGCTIENKGVSDEQSYAIIDENQGAMTGMVTLYAEWVGKAFAIADAGNSDSSSTTAS